MKNKYKNYFRDHYRSTFTEDDISAYKKWFFSQYRFIAAKYRAEENGRILEIGSGFGGFYSMLSEDKKNLYTGLELDADAVTFSNNYFGVNVFQNISLEEFDHKGHFDTIYAFEVLEHMDDPIGNIKKIAKLLVRRGAFIGTSPYPYAKNIFADATHNFVLHPENWKRLFLDYGFNTVKIYPMSFLPYIWRLDRRLNIRIPFYVPFALFISTSLIIAKK